MERIELKIYQAGSTTKLRATANKWKFQDSMMGEQFITLNIMSEKPIDWAVGDWCEFRGDVFTLNYVPSLTQKARAGESGDAFTYENIKFDSRQEELTRCIMLDITPTTGDYIAALGTNYTGSSRFQLFCGETSAVIDGETVTLTPVCALAAKMQANLDRMFPSYGWRVLVDTKSTYTSSSGRTVLVTHTDDKMLSFDNTTVAAALAEVHNTFDLSYSIKGRTIRIGYTLDYLTGDNDDETFAFGYGHGYPEHGKPGTGLFQIKRIANSQQKIVTRLRALGSTKNMPYRYYNKKYGGESNPDLSQSLFPTNLQLPGTFLPEGDSTDAANAKGLTKWSRNNARSEYLRAVKGDTNDAYIDKNDDAEHCPEGIREDSARWDGSNSGLPEIYPTIEGVTFGELREALVEDQTGATGRVAFQPSYQGDDERIDSLLAVGYTDNGVLVDDANIGNGINQEETAYNTTVKTAVIGQRKFDYAPNAMGTDLSVTGDETTLFTVNDVVPGSYFMAPTGGSFTSVVFGFKVSNASVTTNVGFILKVKQRLSSGQETVLAEYRSGTQSVSDTNIHEMSLPELPDVKDTQTGQVNSITVTALCDIVVTFTPVISEMTGGGFILSYQVGRSRLSPSSDYDPEYNWGSVNDSASTNGTFHVFIKDMGFDLTATFTGDTPIMAMKSGRCVGREFEIGENVQRATVNGIRGYLVPLNRATDTNLGTYYPSATDPIAAGDYFVLLGISMPDAYIEAAEARLLMAATDYLSDNCDTKFTYQPSIDDIYLQRQHDNMVKAGTPEKSVFSRLYAGLKFLFRGAPASDDASAPLPEIDITIEQVSIQMGDGLTPKVDIVLNDDIQQTTLQKLTTAVDRIYNGSVYGSGGGASASALYELLLTDGGRMFLSRLNDDTASGKITFNDILTAAGLIKAKAGINVGDFMPGWVGSGASIGADGRSEFEDVYVRGALRAAELVFNKILASEGEEIKSVGHGEIETVSTAGNMGTATLKLDGDEWPTIKVGDICRGLYNTIGKDYDNSASEYDEEDSNGFRNKKGFFSSYFKVVAIQDEGKGVCKFMYALQTDDDDVAVTEHPCPLMKFAVYGNTSSANKDRQSSIYTTAIGVAPRTLFLAGVNDWKIKPENIKIAKGNINGITVWEEISAEQAQQDGTDVETYIGTDGETHYKRLTTLVGDAGFYCEDNIYLGGIIQQIRKIASDEISAQVSHIGEAWIMSNPSDRYYIDCYEDGSAMDAHQFSITVKLYFGNDVCTLDRLNCWVDDGGTSVHPTLSLNNQAAFYDVEIQLGETVNTRTITFTLSGTVNGTTYNMVKTITIVANRQGMTGEHGGKGDKGDDGIGAVHVETNEEYFVVPCNSQGKASERVDMYLEASLKVGDDDAELLKNPIDQCYISYMANRYYFSFNGNLAYKTISLLAGATPSGTMTVTLKGTYQSKEYTKKKKIHVIAQRQGNAGVKGDYKATAFLRTNTDISSTTPTGGNYASPVPNGWNDSIPDGEETLWATTCTFYGDGTDSGWSTPRRMTDTATYDVEFAKKQEGDATPDVPSADNRHGGSGTQVWFDPVLDSAEDFTSMYWRAERECKNGVWGDDWTILRIKGEKGDNGDGVGIERITTYYLLTTKYQGVSVSDFGTDTNYQLPTSALPYLWRYTRFVYTDGAHYDTKPELIYTYSDRPNINLLDDTSFLDLDNMDAWSKKGVLENNTTTPSIYEVKVFDGVFSVEHKGNETGYINYLVQPIADKLSPNTWYTLSFEVQGEYTTTSQSTTRSFWLDLDMKGLFNSSAHRFIDGVESASGNTTIHIVPTTTWTKHTVTFKTPNSIGDNLSAKWQMYTRFWDDTIRMRKPKLEAGMVATDYVSGSTSRQPMARTTRWAAGTAFFKGAEGERYMDFSSVNGKWYQCLKSHTSNDDNKPQEGVQTAYWMPANNFGFIATDLLLADTGVINLLFGNTIYMRNKDNELTASINEDGRGGYIMYYPKSGRKMMEFSPDGYIYRYYDNDKNSEAWNIGLGGDISKATTDAWQEVYLCLLPLGTQTVVTSSSEFIPTKYWQFINGSGNAWAAYDKMYFTTDNPKNPKTLSDNGDTLPNGLYTPDKYPGQMIVGDSTRYYIRALRIVDGKKTEDLIIMQQT